MSSLGARSILVHFSKKKNLTSDGSKPIRVLINPNLSDSDLRLPIGYSLPDFQLHISNFYLQPTAAAAAAAMIKLTGVDP